MLIQIYQQILNYRVKLSTNLEVFCEIIPPSNRNNKIYYMVPQFGSDRTFLKNYAH